MKKARDTKTKHSGAYDDGMHIHLSYFVSDSGSCGDMSLNVEMDKDLAIKGFTSIVD